MIKKRTGMAFTPEMAARLAKQKQRAKEQTALQQALEAQRGQALPERTPVDHSVEVVESLESNDNMG